MSTKKKRTRDDRKASHDKPRSTGDAIAPNRRRRWEIDVRWLRIFCQTTFFLFCFLFAACFHRDFLQQVGEQAFFQDTWTYFLSRIVVVGGLLRYLSDFLTSFFLYPAVGAFFLALLLLFVQMACARLFRLDGVLIPFSLIPSCLLFSAIMKTGFLIFADISANLLFVNVLGTLGAMLFALGYARLDSARSRFVFLVVGTYMLYFAAGFFGIMGLLLALLRECGFPNTQRRTLRIELMFFLGILAPPLFYWLLLSDNEFSMIFFILLPEISGQFLTFYTFYYALAYASLVLLGIVWLARLGILNKTETPIETPEGPPQVSKAALVFSLPALCLPALLMLETVWFAYVWKDLPTVFRMARLMEQGDWDSMLRLPDGHSAPLRPIVLMRNLALFKTGRLGNEAFTYSQYSRRHNLLEIVTSINVCGQRIMYEYGYVNLAYRFSLNHLIMRDKNISDLKMLARCAMANGESALARKYLRIIHGSPFHRRWAAWRLCYLDAVSSHSLPLGEELGHIADEVETIRKLIPKENSILHKRQALDRLLLDVFYARNFQTASDDVREMILFLALQQKQIKTFSEHFENWFRERSDQNVTAPMPVHFQEGMIVASDDPKKTLDEYHISPEVRNRYHELTRFVEENQELQRRKPVEFADLLRERFGRTYWYFYLGVGGLHVY